VRGLLRDPATLPELTAVAFDDRNAPAPTDG